MPGRHSGDQVHKAKKTAAPPFDTLPLRYIVYSDDGLVFSLSLGAEGGAVGYTVTWFDAVTGAVTKGAAVHGGPGGATLTPPDEGKHWVAMLLAVAHGSA